MSRPSAGRRQPRRWRLAVAAAVVLVGGAVGCRRDGAAPAAAASSPATVETPRGPFTVYCGRSAELMAPLFERFGEESGISLVVRYGGSWDLQAALVEEGTRTPAAAFLAQDAAALGALSRKGMLRELPMELVQQVDPRFTGTESKHDWLGLSARARAVVYDPARVALAVLPRGLDELADEKYQGRFGLAPSNDSFEAQLALERVLRGPEGLAELLSVIRSSRPRLYVNNAAVVQAVAHGDIDFGLVNHYSLWREAERVPSGRLAVSVMGGRGATSFVNAAGVGLLSGDPRGLDLVRFLLAQPQQETFAARTFEYPLAKGMAPPPGLPPLSSLRTPSFDFADVAVVLPETERAIRRAGLLP